jgi:beta-phosphoglucomutase
MSSDNGAVIWDVDGTLVDTAEMHFQAWEKLCAELGRPFSRADFAATFGRRNPEIFQYLFGNRFDTAKVDELGFHKEELYRAAARQGVELLPGAPALLEGLHAAGFKQAVGSSAPLANVELILQITHSAQFFDAISSAEDTQRGKPDPQVFEVAARKLGVPAAKCVVMEDAVAGVEAAKAGGMKCIAVSFVGHHPEAKLRAAGADMVVPTLEKVSVQAVRELVAAGKGL